MKTECTPKQFEFQLLGSRKVECSFDGRAITSDAGGLLLREVEARFGIIRQFAECFKDYRDADSIEHTVFELVAQRIYGLALGYEDLNDHDALRHDPLMATLRALSSMKRTESSIWEAWRAGSLFCLSRFRSAMWQATLSM